MTTLKPMKLKTTGRRPEQIVGLFFTFAELASYAHTLSCAEDLFEGLLRTQADRLSEQEEACLLRLAGRTRDLAEKLTLIDMEAETCPM